MQGNKILRGEEEVNILGISLIFPQITNEHYKVCVITIIVSYVGGEQLRTSMKATSLPSSTVD